MYAKAALLLAIVLLSCALLLVDAPAWRTAALLLLVIWGSARLYYFLFYVIERYIDPSYRFSGVISALRYSVRRRKQMTTLLDHRAHDGSRQFASLPESRSWERLRDHAASFPGATVTGFLTDGVVEAWIDFTVDGERFTVNNQLGEYWFFVSNPNADEALLHRVVQHFARLLGHGA
jgi:hypothetical protein